MSEEQKNSWEFKQEDIFQDIEGDPENVLMTIPPEIMEKMGWKEGDTIKVLLGDQGTIIIEKIKENSGEEEQNTNEQA
jgi:AbrB family looped-hinge helix DNA binding protein